MESPQPPVIDSHLEDRSSKTEGPRPQSVRRLVLVVEDDPANRELLIDLLSDWGYQPLAVGSAEEAEFAIKGKDLDAAIVDVFLPGKGGEALMDRLRERHPDCVLVGISALTDSAVARRCKGHGADLFIGKPIPAKALAEALKSEHHSWH